jgi:hypothetical protein
MVLAAPGPLLRPPSSSPKKTPIRSYSAQIRSQNEEKTCVCVCVRESVCIVFIYMHMCMCMYVYIYIAKGACDQPPMRMLTRGTKSATT